MEIMKYYDILNYSIIISGSSTILQIKPTPKPTEKYICDDGNGNGTLIMIIIVSVVGRAFIIAIIIGCFIYRSKKKKSAISNEASTNEDENKP